MASPVEQDQGWSGHARRSRRSAVVPALATGILLAALVSGCGTATSRDHASDSAATATSGSVDPTEPPTSVDPGVLSQTTDRPGADDAALSAGAQMLWQAVVAGDPDQAMPFFFPLSAYLQVKDVKDPAADWQNRLVAAFGHDVRRLHDQLGSDATLARFVGLDVPSGRATWVQPGQEHNKIGYWRVYGTTLRYTVGASTKSLPIYSLISWRGVWYVVHVGPP